MSGVSCYCPMSKFLCGHFAPRHDPAKILVVDNNVQNGSRRCRTYLLELLDGSLINTTALVDQVTCNV